MLDNESISNYEVGSQVILKHKQWFVIAGRYNVFFIKSPGLKITLKDETLFIENKGALYQSGSYVNLVSKNKLSSISTELSQIQYGQLWYPLALFAHIIEEFLVILQSKLLESWGLVIILFSIFLKLVLLPISLMTARHQDRVSKIRTALSPRLEYIRRKYSGEEAHNYVLDAHRDMGVSTFYALKPMLGLFIQIPILIAVFNVLGELPGLRGESFLWIDDLAYPDALASLPLIIPMFGETLNILPFVMMVISIISIIILDINSKSDTDINRQKHKLYLMALAFFVLFYPFPAAVVLFWISNIILHVIHQRVFHEISEH